MNVLLDTNIYLADLTFSTPRFQALKSYLSMTNSKLLVPKVVEEEINRNLREAASNEEQKILKLHSSRLGLIDSPPKSKDISRALFAELKKNILNKKTFVSLDYDNVSLQELIYMATLKSRPFNEKGRGFLDAVIWKSFVSYLSDTDYDAAFISNDKDAFGTDEELPSAFTEELALAGHTGRVLLFNSLERFLELYNKPLDFLNEEYIIDALKGLSDDYLNSLSLKDIDTNPSTEIEISSYSLNTTEVKNFYVYEATSDEYHIYVSMDYILDVEGSYRSEVSVSRNEIIDDNTVYDIGWVNREYLIYVDKIDKAPIHVDYLGF
jgi:hypothetical protein